MPSEYNNRNSNTTDSIVCQNGCGNDGNVLLGGVCFQCFQAFYHQNKPHRPVFNDDTTLSPALSLVSNDSGRMSLVSDVISSGRSTEEENGPTAEESVSATMGSTTERLRLFMSPSTPESMNVRNSLSDDERRLNLLLDSHNTDTMGFDTDLTREYSHSDSNTWMEDHREDSDSDTMSDDFLKSYLRARRAADLEWNRPNPDLYHQNITDGINIDREISLRRPDYISLTADNYHNYIPDRELASTRFDSSGSDLDDILLDVNSASDMMNTANDDARLFFTPSITDSRRPENSPIIGAWTNFKRHNQNPHTMSPEPDLSREDDYSDTDALMGDFQDDSDPDFISNAYQSYLNARQAADLDWARSSPHLY